ncbi:MAG: Dabb family protein [Desulfovibrio sp.]|nr:Dabb family protein [Desulfovibrio sp.]
MIRHIFMASMKPNVEAHVVDEAIAELQTFEGKISGMSGLVVQRNLGWFNKKIDIVLTADFVDKAAWDAFINHPQHAAIVEKYMPLYDASSIATAQVAL